MWGAFFEGAEISPIALWVGETHGTTVNAKNSRKSRWVFEIIGSDLRVEFTGRVVKGISGSGSVFET